MITREPTGRPVALVGEAPSEDAFGFGGVWIEYQGETRCIGVGNPYRGVDELVALADELNNDPDTARELWERNAPRSEALG